MSDWQVVPKRSRVSGVKFRLGGTSKLTVYIGARLRKTIKDYSPDGWCNVYKNKDSLMVQLVSKPDGNSRRVGNNLFSLPYSLVSKHWQDGKREKEIPAMVEKGNLILLNLRDLGK